MKIILRFFLSLGLITVLELGCHALFSPLLAQGTGISVYPLQVDYGHITTEYVGLVQHGDGAGLQVRYTQKFNSMTTLEGGVGIGNADLNNRAFLAADLEFFPDYGQQPRISVKPFIETAREYNTRRTIVGAGPILSKSFTIGDNSIYPFIGLPTSLVLDVTRQTYNFRSLVAFGAAGKLPIGEVQNIILNVEGNISLQNSFSSLFVGLSYPFI